MLGLDDPLYPTEASLNNLVFSLALSENKYSEISDLLLFKLLNILPK